MDSLRSSQLRYFRAASPLETRNRASVAYVLRAVVAMVVVVGRDRRALRSL